MKQLILSILLSCLFCVNNGGNTTTYKPDYTMSDSEAVMDASLNLTYSDFVFTNPDTDISVTHDFSVPLTGLHNTDITWSSTYSELTVNNDLIVVNRPVFGSGNNVVILTASITKNTTSLDKQFVLTIIEQDPLSGDSVSYMISASFNMVYVKAKSFPTGLDDLGVSSVNSDYMIGTTEVTYLQWLEVRIWAQAHGYTFVNPGVMGDGTGDTDQHPVTNVSWRDALVWTNALTEYYNTQQGTNYACVFTSDATYQTPIRTSTSSSIVDTNPGSIDNPFVNPTAQGFRLPTKSEWALAARYIGDNNNDGDILDNGEYYPGSHVSGDTSGDYLISVIIGDYVWYTSNSNNSTNIVGTRLANALGLFDMTGNVMEWVFDWDINNVNVYRNYRGGGWNLTPVNLQLGKVFFNSPQFISSTTGFRVAKFY